MCWSSCVLKARILRRTSCPPVPFWHASRFDTCITVQICRFKFSFQSISTWIGKGFIISLVDGWAIVEAFLWNNTTHCGAAVAKSGGSPRLEILRRLFETPTMACFSKKNGNREAWNSCSCSLIHATTFCRVLEKLRTRGLLGLHSSPQKQKLHTGTRLGISPTGWGCQEPED